MDPRSRPDVRWHPSSDDADAALRLHVAEALGGTPDELRTGRLCPACGSDTHGRPWVAGRRRDHDVGAVSLARAGPHLVTAVSRGGAVGVDVESVAEVAARWADLDVPTAGDPGPDPASRASAWCRTEAVAKLAGTGLGSHGGQVPAGHQVTDLPAPPGFAAALAWSQLG